MAFRMVTFQVLRIPCVKYNLEQYTVDSVHQTEEDVVKKLKEDPNVIDFYIVR